MCRRTLQRLLRLLQGLISETRGHHKSIYASCIEVSFRGSSCLSEPYYLLLSATPQSMVSVAVRSPGTCQHPLVLSLQTLQDSRQVIDIELSNNRLYLFSSALFTPSLPLFSFFFCHFFLTFVSPSQCHLFHPIRTALSDVNFECKLVNDSLYYFLLKLISLPSKMIPLLLTEFFNTKINQNQNE